MRSRSAFVTEARKPYCSLITPITSLSDGDDELELLLRDRAIESMASVSNGLTTATTSLPSRMATGTIRLLAREGPRDLRLDHLDVELERIDLEERQLRVLGDEAREQEVVDARAVAAGVGEVHRR